MLQEWRLPETIAFSVAGRYAPEQGEGASGARVLHLASCMAASLNADLKSEAGIFRVTPEVVTAAGVSYQEYSDIVVEAGQRLLMQLDDRSLDVEVAGLIRGGDLTGVRAALKGVEGAFLRKRLGHLIEPRRVGDGRNERPNRRSLTKPLAALFAYYATASVLLGLLVAEVPLANRMTQLLRPSRTTVNSSLSSAATSPAGGLAL